MKAPRSSPTLASGELYARGVRTDADGFKDDD